MTVAVLCFYLETCFGPRTDLNKLLHTSVVRNTYRPSLVNINARSFELSW